MHDVTFSTDGEFRGAEVRTIRPRGISFPLPPAAVPHVAPLRRAPAFF
jgi:hypothetical protein